ncbi:hypothetical protein C8J56DRAFT_190933 [Mycena floridula]|nr:hypothetical protein C8J56DRAFT_190933 [Mycena floridula]
MKRHYHRLHLKDSFSVATSATEALYQCSQCSKILRSPNGLRVHQNSHTRDLSLSCEFCHKIFNVKSTLTRHQCLKHPMSREQTKSLDSDSECHLPRWSAGILRMRSPFVGRENSTLESRG